MPFGGSRTMPASLTTPFKVPVLFPTQRSGAGGRPAGMRPRNCCAPSSASISSHASRLTTSRRAILARRSAVSPGAALLPRSTHSWDPLSPTRNWWRPSSRTAALTDRAPNRFTSRRVAALLLRVIIRSRSGRSRLNCAPTMWGRAWYAATSTPESWMPVPWPVARS